MSLLAFVAAGFRCFLLAGIDGALPIALFKVTGAEVESHGNLRLHHPRNKALLRDY